MAHISSPWPGGDGDGDDDNDDEEERAIPFVAAMSSFDKRGVATQFGSDIDQALSNQPGPMLHLPQLRPSTLPSC